MEFLMRGDTRKAKDELKALGGRWDAEKRLWVMPDATYQAALAAVLAVTKDAYQRSILESAAALHRLNNAPESERPALREAYQAAYARSKAIHSGN